MALQRIDNNQQGYKFADEQEKRLLMRFEQDYVESKNNFLTYHKDRFDKFYKLYRAYTGDRAKLIKDWQSNVFTPYIFSVVETLLPRILGSRPDFTVMARNKEDVGKERVAQQLLDYVWEMADMDAKNAMFVKNALIYGTSFGKTRWEKRYTVSSILTRIEEEDGYKLPKYEEKSTVVYDNPQFDYVDPYDFFPDKHGSTINGSYRPIRFGYQRHLTTLEGLRAQYPNAKNLQYVSSRMGSPYGSVDTTDYKLVRKEALSNKNQIYQTSEGGYDDDSTGLIEVVERWESGRVIIRANGVPIVNIPNPYSHSEIPYTVVRYVEMPGEMYGIGLPETLENLQVMLNSIKNQRIDNVTLSIHKMWIVDPLSNINKNDLITKPFGIIYSNNPGSVRPVEFSDIKASAYQEEDRLKDDMRNATGVDDYSRGAGAIANSATEASYLREATLERVRLFLRGLEQSYEDIMRQWFALIKDFFPEKKQLRVVTSENGEKYYPLIAKDDYNGEFDFKVGANSTVSASREIQKKQAMDLTQILLQLEEVDRRNVISELLSSFGWDPNFILKNKEKELSEAGKIDPTEALMEGVMPPGMQGGASQASQGAPGIPPGLMGMAQAANEQPRTLQGNTVPEFGRINTDGGAPSVDNMLGSSQNV